jgi:biotin carboxylase
VKTIICLKGSAEAVPILERVKALGHRIVLVDPDLGCAGRGLADEFIQANHYDAAETFGAVHASGISPDAVLCCGGDTPVTAAGITEFYGLPGLTVAQARLSVDKLAQKTALKSAGLPVPRFAELEEGHYFNFSSPNPDIVLKPVDSRGARGVRRLRFGQPQDFGVILRAAEQASPTNRVMVEEWLDGPQLSTESIVVGGRALTMVGLRNYERLEEYVAVAG